MEKLAEMQASIAIDDNTSYLQWGNVYESKAHGPWFYLLNKSLKYR